MTELTVDRRRIRRLRAALDGIGYDRVQRAMRGSFAHMPYPSFREFSGVLRRFEPRLKPWFELLLLGRSLAVPEAERALGPVLEDLLELGVLMVRRDRVRSNGFGLTSFADRYFIARLDPDYPTGPGVETGVYIGPSSFRLAAELPLGRALRSALDVGSGSGLLAVLLASTARRVFATDVNPAAVQAARFNAILNGVDDRVVVREGPRFTPVPRQRFEFVVFNLPFVASPPGIELPAATGGGEDGLATVAPVVRQLGSHLTRDGWALAYFEGDGDRSRPYIVDRLKPSLRAGGLDLEVLITARWPIAERLRSVELHPRLGRAGTWRRWLKERGATRYYAMLARFMPGTGKAVVIDAVPGT